MQSLKEILKESLLSDTDINARWDDYIKQQEKKISKFLKTIGSASKYKKMGGYKISGFIQIDDIEDILNLLGFDTDYIELCLVDSWPNGNIPQWWLNVTIGSWDKTIYPDDTYITDPKVFIKELIKPLTKDIDTFKKFLNNMEKFNRQHVNMNDLLK